MRKRLLFICNLRAPFVTIDEALLRERYDLHLAYIQQRSPKLLWQMWRQTREVDVVVAWFASWHSLPGFIAAWLRRVPRVVIVGGYDVANMPEIGYGLHRGGIAKYLSGLVYRLATHVVPFSAYAYQEALSNTPAIPAKTTAILLAVPDEPAFAQPSVKAPLVFTVATIDRLSAVRKGIHRLIEAAVLLPDITFVVVGRGKDETLDQLKQTAPANVQFTGFMPDEELVALRHRAQVYVQASAHEGFGLAVAEAMLARCIPVITRSGSLPEVVGETGLYVESDDPQALAAAIRKALEAPASQGEAARVRVQTEFALAKRAGALYALLDALMADEAATAPRSRPTRNK